MKSDVKQLNHISFIMDGNGRWAKKRFLPRSMGHSEGVAKAKEVILHIKKLGIRYVSLYTFSKENWKRAQDEVSFLMGLILKHLREDFNFYVENKIGIKHIGDRSGLSDDILKAIDKVEADTKDFTDITVLLVFNYSGKYDIAQAYNRMAAEGLKDITEDKISDYLLTAGYPDPDLIIRTSNEFRISNYFLYQAAYSEFIIIDKLWPDLQMKDIDGALDIYFKRDRRFGGVKDE